LLGSSSRIENHPFARALWRQISGPAALIQAPNELDTSVIIPSFSTNAESLYFELEVENSLGETSIAQTQVIAVSDPTNVLFFDVDSHLGGSSSSTLKATLTADNSSYIDVYYGSESLDIEFSSAGVNSPRVSLGLFSGMPNTPIAPGEYLDTQRYPDFGEPRLQFSSSSSSCTLRGGFNVHELAVDSNNQVLRAAIDFVGLCSDYTLPNKGSIRINSTRRIEFPALP